MNFNFGDFEIDDVSSMKVDGEWIKFIDGDGARVKIPPFVIKQLMMFALEHVTEFEEGAWE